MKLFIGIEGIATRFSIAVLSDETGKIIASRRLLGQSLSLHTIPRKLLQIRLYRLIKEVMQNAGLGLDSLKNTTLSIGLTGTTFAYDREVDLQREILSMDLNLKRLICTGDAEIIFAAFTQQSNGSAIICHCGSTAYVVTKSGDTIYHKRFGGWGPALGDEGSAYWMGMQVLRDIGYEHDLIKNNYSVLWQKVDEWLNNPNNPADAYLRGSQHWRKIRSTFKKWQQDTGKDHDPRTLIFYFAHVLQNYNEVEQKYEGFEFWRRIAGGLVIPLMRAFREGDATAQGIIDKAAESLIWQHKQAYELLQKKCGIFDFEPLVLYGGVINHNPDFVQKIVERANKEYQRIVTPLTLSNPNAMRPAIGALLFALGDSHTSQLRLPTQQIIDNVRAGQCQKEFAEDLKND